MVVRHTAEAREGTWAVSINQGMSVTGVSAAFSSLFRGNYSGCVAWRQQDPQAQLVGNTTQVAVNPLALTPASPPASPEPCTDKNQTVTFWDECMSGIKNNISAFVFLFFFILTWRRLLQPFLSSLLLRHWNVLRDIFCSLDRCSYKNCYKYFLKQLVD